MPCQTMLPLPHPLCRAAEVEMLSRVMRKFDIDGIIDPSTATLGEMIIKVGGWASRLTLAV